MLELPSLLLQTLIRVFRRRRELVLENLVLRHQLQIALRSRPRPRLKTRDRLFWLVARRLDRDWKQHLILIRPETVVGCIDAAGGSTGAGAQVTTWVGLDCVQRFGS